MDLPNKNGVYKKPAIYTFKHVALGLAAAYFPLIVIPAFVAWQFAQLMLGRRFFLLTLSTKPGNSARHTAKKFAEFIAGLGLGILLRYAITSK